MWFVCILILLVGFSEAYNCQYFDWFLSTPEEQDTFMLNCYPGYISILHPANPAAPDQPPDVPPSSGNETKDESPVDPAPDKGSDVIKPTQVFEMDGISYKVGDDFPDNIYKTILTIKFSEITKVTQEIVSAMTTAFSLTDPRDLTTEEAEEITHIPINNDKTTFSYKLYITIKDG